MSARRVLLWTFPIKPVLCKGLIPPQTLWNFCELPFLLYFIFPIRKTNKLYSAYQPFLLKKPLHCITGQNVNHLASPEWKRWTQQVKKRSRRKRPVEVYQQYDRRKKTAFEIEWKITSSGVPIMAHPLTPVCSNLYISCWGPACEDTLCRLLAVGINSADIILCTFHPYK